MGYGCRCHETPFRDSWFDVAAAVHSIRNFGSVEAVRTAVKEMKRVVKPGGYVILVENIPVAKRTSEESLKTPFAEGRVHQKRAKIS